jgi:hypothetical protein
MEYHIFFTIRVGMFVIGLATWTYVGYRTDNNQAIPFKKKTRKNLDTNEGDD